MISALRLALPVCAVLVASACGGGGGGGDGGSPSPPPPPPPGTDPTRVALERPVSSRILCSNGLAKRAAAVSEERFESVGPALGIDHAHAVNAARWGPGNDAFEGAMRTAAVIAGDFNGDCWPDLMFAAGPTAAGQLLRYDNDQGLAFAPRSVDVMLTANVIAGLGTADLDGDYRLDFVVGNLLAGQAQVYLGAADGGFVLEQAIPMARSTFGFAFGDYSGDGRLDVYAAHWDRTPLAGQAPVVLRNTGTAGNRLVDADASAGTTPAELPQDFQLAPGFVDFSGDAVPDLLVSADATSSVALGGSGAGTLPLVADGSLFTIENAAGSAIADFDNDGRWDWFLTGPDRPADSRPWPWGDSGNRLHWGQATNPWFGPAEPATGIDNASWPWGVCAQDFNNDGLTDLFVENGFGLAPDGVRALLDDPAVADEFSDLLADRHFTPARLLINQGNRTFVDAAPAWGIAAATGGRGVACLDYDRDGDIDIAVAQNSGPAIVHENHHSGVDGHGFIAVRLTSVPPNGLAVGAEVTVEADGVTQRRQVAANSNFLGQDPHELHFGLGAAGAVDRVEVRWPDGGSSTYTDLAPNRFYSLLDPRFPAYADSPRLGEVDAALAAATTYVVNHAGDLPDDGMTSLAWARRIYGVVLPFSPADVLIAREAQYRLDGQDAEAAAVRAFLGLVIEDHVLSAADFAALQGLNAVTMHSVFCHQYPLDNAWVASLEALVGAGGYDTTHAMLALIWAIDNDCALPAVFDRQVFDDNVRAVYEIAASTSAITDLRVEAFAFLAAAGRLDLIRPLWLAQLLDAQQADGGWKGEPSDAEVSGHTTSLALWFLLQLAENGAVSSGFVPQSWEPQDTP